jgi:hypothetical protein
MGYGEDACHVLFFAKTCYGSNGHIVLKREVEIVKHGIDHLLATHKCIAA